MKTSEAAHALNVSATTLRAWEARYGFPTPARTLGRHRVYERGEILALRRALDEGLSVSSAIEKVRSNLGIDETQLESALRGFDSAGADAAMEAALAVKRLDTCVQEVLLCALAGVRARSGEGGAAWAFACRWAVDWLRRQARLGLVAPAAPLVLIGDAGSGPLDTDAPAVATLEMFCARAGMMVLTLPVRCVAGLAEAAETATVVVVAGGHCAEEELRCWLGSVRAAAGPVPLLFFRTGARLRGALADDPRSAQRAVAAAAERSVRLAAAHGTPAPLAPARPMAV